MKPKAYNFDFGIEDDYLVLTWTRLQDTSDVDALLSYPELKMRIKYRDISTDTVSAMLRNLEVPHQFSQAILTLIAAQAA
ncbi:MAG: hypothetical protein OXI77_01180 [Chloroflexota bacterium]|nr:hypothetical protein [Chloroflexota bacterium]MDE2908747.1 hypothetical protein [Chloroflexota bacterium]